MTRWVRSPNRPESTSCRADDDDDGGGGVGGSVGGNDKQESEVDVSDLVSIECSCVCPASFSVCFCCESVVVG